MNRTGGAVGGMTGAGRRCWLALWLVAPVLTFGGFATVALVSAEVAAGGAPDLPVAELPAGTAPDSPVADAAQRGDLAVVRRLLRDGADVNAAQGDGMTALHWAAERGNHELAEVLLYAGARVDAGTRIGHYTPLHLAARAAHGQVVALLLDADADPDARTTNSGASALHLAAGAGDPSVIESLVKAGAGVNAREAAWGQTPLIFAAANDRADAIRVLLDAGADPSLAAYSVDVEERASADQAAERRLDEFLATFKEKEGGGTDWQPTPRQVQAAIEASQEIQRKWPDVPDPADDGEEAEEGEEGQEGEGGEEGEVPDTAAAVDTAPESAETAAEAPETTAAESDTASPESPADEEPRPMSYAQLVGSWGGLTPLLHAVRQGHRAAAEVLLAGGADIDQPSEGDGTTPVLMAAVNGQFDLALWLIDRGADPNAASAAGATPLFAVLERQWAPRASYAHPTEHEQQAATHLDVLEALLDAGADPNPRLKSHLWYMEYTFGVLRGSGINLQGATPFWRAAYALDVDAMRLLKEHGADPNIATMKPPQRRRRPPASEEEEEKTEEKVEKAEAEEAKAEGQAAEAGEQSKPEGAAFAEATEGESVPTKGNAEAETVAEEGEAPRPGARDAEEDFSGVPPVPVGGPHMYPIHAASGVGYGQSFAGNAHRHVPDNWLAAVRFLVEECGAGVNVRDANAYTALHHAASRGDSELVLYLVEHGADVTVVSRRGQTTADMANGPIQRLQPFPATVALLEELGSKNNHRCLSC
ncbi:MAG: ankyrin repeat domain-containing protein [Gemmatimonadota bacterium]|nr:ankyrin repeat domain-containing protein [Gemmatimonadota bacterium]